MAKRGQGEGTISKREDGTWWARITIGKDKDGKQKRKAFYGKTRKEVQEKLTAALNDVNNDMYIEPSKLTVEQWMDIFLTDYKKNSIRVSTYAKYYGMNKKFIVPKLGKHKLIEVRHDMVQRFLNELVELSLAPKTIKHYRSLITMAFQQAYEIRLITRNPLVNLKIPKLIKKDRRVLSKEEQKHFIALAKETKYGNIFIFLLGTGLRIGEALALTWNDVDFENNTIFINKTLTRTKDPVNAQSDEKFYGIGPVKTHAGNRYIPLANSIVSLLKQVELEQKNNKSLWGDTFNDSNLVFCSDKGKLLTHLPVWKQFREIMERIGIDYGENFSIHCLRHTFATRGLENGIELKVMQELLGHSNISMTANTYTHVLPNKKKEAISKIESTIS